MISHMIKIYIQFNYLIIPFIPRKVIEFTYSNKYLNERSSILKM